MLVIERCMKGGYVAHIKGQDYVLGDKHHLRLHLATWAACKAKEKGAAPAAPCKPLGVRLSYVKNYAMLLPTSRNGALLCNSSLNLSRTRLEPHSHSHAHSYSIHPLLKVYGPGRLLS
jgi:hypothetical protein